MTEMAASLPIPVEAKLTETKALRLMADWIEELLALNRRTPAVANCISTPPSRKASAFDQEMVR